MRAPSLRAGRVLSSAMLLSLVSLSLTGCLSALHTGQVAVAPADMATAASAPIRNGSPDITLTPGTLVATGTVRDGAFVRLGRVEIRATTDDYRIRFLEYRPMANVEVLGSINKVDPTSDCDTDTANEVDLGSLLPGPTQALRMSDNANRFPRHDPSFLISLVLISLDGVEACPVVIHATADLQWRLPSMNPRLHPFDLGTRAQASGIVQPQDGIPESYTAAASDTWSAVATRFGVTVDDLEWLNPSTGPRAPLRIGETLNLDPGARQ